MNLVDLSVVEELSLVELTKIEGGSELSDSICWLAGAICHGISVFATEGGRNAGLCVR